MEIKMKTAIRYYSKTGNTEKLAQELGKALNIKVETIDVPLSEDVDILFLGNSLYNNNVDKEIKKFIQNTDRNIKKVVSFGTSGTGKTTFKKLKKILDKKGISLASEEFFTKGHYIGHSRGMSSEINTGKPDANDLKELRTFAKKFIE